MGYAIYQIITISNHLLIDLMNYTDVLLHCSQTGKPQEAYHFRKMLSHHTTIITSQHMYRLEVCTRWYKIHV